MFEKRIFTEPDGSGGSLNIDGVWVKRGSVEPIDLFLRRRKIIFYIPIWWKNR